MGLDIDFYVLPKELHHDKTKEICLDLEYEPEPDDYKLAARLYKIAYPDTEIDLDKDGEPNENWMLMHPIGSGSSFYKFKHDTTRWCAKCSLFMHGVDENSNVIDSISIHRSNSDSVVKSDFFIKYIYAGRTNTNFVRSFSTDHQYREITPDDITLMENNIQLLGRAIRDSDRLALAETMQVMDFLKKYQYRDDLVIVSQES